MREQKKKLALSGDGRAESQGHSARYGSYTVKERSRYVQVLILLSLNVLPLYRVMKLWELLHGKTRASEG